MSSFVDQSFAAARAVACIGNQAWVLLSEVPAVFHFMAVLEANALPPEHPWVTGRPTPSSEPLWPSNVIYSSPNGPRSPQERDEQDAIVVHSVGRFLAKMVTRSVTPVEIPQGPRRRMPHAVNYIHGAVHYNGAYLVFEDLEDMLSHATNREFRRDLRRFVASERRELTFVLRTRAVDPVEYSYAIGTLRTHLPWFSNGNGPTKKPVLWGNLSPYPAINFITGWWMRDLWRLSRKKDVVREPVEHRLARRYPPGERSQPTRIERAIAWAMATDIRLRGFRGQLFFTNRKKIEPHRIAEYRAAGGYLRWSGCHPVPRPFGRGKAA